VIKQPVPPLKAMVKAVESFALGGVAGAIGATFGNTNLTPFSI